MKLLLDECVVQDFRFRLLGHEVRTVGYAGWAGVKNGRLLGLAAADEYDAVITTDLNIIHQQKLSALPVSLVVMHVKSNDLNDLLPLLPELLAALQSLSPRSVVHLGAV